MTKFLAFFFHAAPAAAHNDALRANQFEPVRAFSAYTASMFPRV